MKLSDNLKNIRKERNLSQEQLAEKLGVSRQAVSKWESGQSYPEMDKVLLMCKIFNYNIDELMNENVKEVDQTKQSKININKYIDDFFAFITKTIDMLENMNLKEKLKCFMEQIIVSIFLIIIFSIIGAISSNILSGLLGGISNRIYNFFESIYLILALILGITIILHVFKIRYLDYFEIVRDNEENDNINQENIEGNERKKVFIEKKKEKIIIRDSEHSQSKFLTGIIRIVFACIKFMVAWIAVGFAFSFVGLVAGLVLSFLFVKTGLMFVGVLIGTISALMTNFVILEVLFNFIISKTTKKNRMAIVLIISLVLAGISIGIIMIGTTKFNYIEDNTSNSEIENEYNVEMSDDLYINECYCNLEYIETDTNEIKIVAKHSKYYIVNYINDKNKIYIQFVNDETKYMELIRNIIKDINNKEIKNYNIPTVYVYASKDNIEKLKENRAKKYEKQRQNEMIILQEQMSDLQEQVREYEEEIQEKDEVIESLNEQLEQTYNENKIMEE